MKVYKIKVNGKTYEVEVESVSEGTSTASNAPVAQASSGSSDIKAPMAGSILDVKVSVGSKVNVGDTVVILEAMKLENEVKSQVSGIVKEIKVSKGSQVKNGDVIIILG